jgi:diacylglycerol kinase family enzyme
VNTVRATHLELHGNAPIQIDGEFVGRTPATVDLVPDALTLLIPPAYE